MMIMLLPFSIVRARARYFQRPGVLLSFNASSGLFKLPAVKRLLSSGCLLFASCWLLLKVDVVFHLSKIQASPVSQMACVSLADGIFPGRDQFIRVFVSRLWQFRGGFEAGSVKQIHLVLNDEQQDTGLCKSLLQEYADKMNYTLPSYISKQASVVGPFICTIQIGGVQYIGAAALTEKESLVKAARTALLAIHDWKWRSLRFNTSHVYDGYHLCVKRKRSNIEMIQVELFFIITTSFLEFLVVLCDQVRKKITNTILAELQMIGYGCANIHIRLMKNKDGGGTIMAPDWPKNPRAAEIRKGHIYKFVFTILGGKTHLIVRCFLPIY